MNESERKDEEDSDISLLLKLAGPREKLPQELKQNWESVFRQELKAAAKSRQSRRRKWIAGVAATVAFCALLLNFIPHSPAPEPVTMVRVSSLSGSAAMTGVDGKTTELEKGMHIATGSLIETGSDSRVGLNYGGYSLRIDINSRVTLHASAVHLVSGQVYASDAVQRIGLTQLNITTPQGSVRDIGTQFTVRVSAEGTVATVRQGIILVDTGASEFQIEAQRGSAARLWVNNMGEVQSTQVSATGENWRWIYALVEPFELEGKSIYDFLQWSVSETGGELVFSRASDELYARRVLLHGSATGLDPERALLTVLEATDLKAQRQGDTLLVSSRR
ncbi:FecR family protein [Pseudohalioglobus lutimaris]|uniref:FecR protein domain-containing protein n=1 Tax=Pseudohalioglobus lutimaris TaxID=1737061 RepID=A0A2N5X839_9GAMM|nr:FecR family protein [Pseudohalioglobus lutimaris]PLW70655.1 hypothetical protein C0039_00540 [Pseudohalioglobus lutimaris]